MCNEIEICLAANGKYFPGMFTTAVSIAMHASRECKLSYNILETDIKDDDYNLMITCVLKQHANSEFHRFNINEYDFSKLQSWHGNKLAYARFLIGELRPDLDYVVYCDVDMLWLADIAELWKLRRDDISVLGPYDGHSHDIGEDLIFRAQGYEFNEETYYCSGLLLMNLKRMRERRVADKCIEFLKGNHNFICPDQSALNIITKGDSSILPRMWMLFTFDIRERYIEKPIVLHYANELPWLRRKPTDLITDTVFIWFKVYANARGEGVWRALRRFFSPQKIVFSRVIFLLMSNQTVSFMLHCLMSLFRCGNVYWGMKNWSRRVSVKGSL